MKREPHKEGHPYFGIGRTRPHNEVKAMKTPMQEHIEWLEDKYKTLLEQGYVGAAYEIFDCISNAESLLEKEKEVMCEFAWEYERGCRINLERSIEKCWDKTFNTPEQ